MLKMKPLAGAFLLLLCLFLVSPCIGSNDRETVVIFPDGKTQYSHKDTNGEGLNNLVPAFRVPAFVGGVVDKKEFFAVLCDARYEGTSGSSFILPTLKTSYANYKEWNAADIFSNETLANGETSVLEDITAVMKGNKIYALASSFKKGSTDKRTNKGTSTWVDSVMFEGTVTKPTDSRGDGAIIKWEKQTSLKHLLISPQGLVYSYIHFVGGGGNGVVMKNGNIVFPIQITKSNGYFLSSTVYSTDDGTTWKIGGHTYSGVTEGSVAEFGAGKLFFSLRSDNAFRHVYESTNMGTTWEVSPIFFGVWGNNNDRKGPGSQGSVITAPVDGKDILLFAHPLYTESNRIRHALELWVSDGKRIMCVGRISEYNNKDMRIGNSILAYIENNLYVTYESNPNGSLNKTLSKLGVGYNAIAISPLPQLFESAKNTARTWRHLDTSLDKKGIPTKDLVGVWGNTKKEDKAVWEDMYNCVNATVIGGESVSGGFRFNGKPGSGAKWPVERQGQNQLYKFTDKEFTLTATVIIHNTSGAAGLSLFGAKSTEKNSESLIGIGYTEDMQWYTVHSKTAKNVTEFSFELEREYHIAITLKKRMMFVYVDGLAITNETRTPHSLAYIDYFYMGEMSSDSKAEGNSCTVKNVMLFTRCFDEQEIDKLLQVSKNVNFDKETLIEESKSETQRQKTIPTMEPVTVPENRNSAPTVKRGTSPMNNRLVLTTKPKEEPAPNKKTLRNENKGGESADHFTTNDLNVFVTNQINIADNAALSLAVVPIMCLVCSVIALGGL